jgi:hypothetical protein
MIDAVKLPLNEIWKISEISKELGWTRQRECDQPQLFPIICLEAGADQKRPLKK